MIQLAQKPDKPCRLYYLASRAVDTHGHVITHMQAEYADERDSRHLMSIVDKLSSKLPQLGLPMKRVVADGGFASGLNGPATSMHRLHALLESARIKAFVTLPGSYRPN